LKTGTLILTQGKRGLPWNCTTTVAKLPLICPHGHVDPRPFSDENVSFGTPTDLLIIPDPCGKVVAVKILSDFGRGEVRSDFRLFDGFILPPPEAVVIQR
jgi:hypothetical protein